MRAVLEASRTFGAVNSQSHLLAIGRDIALLFAIIGANVTTAGENANVWQAGFWKSTPMPPHATGEFGNHDPYGLSIGVWIKTDCSIYWISPDTNKLYCFNSLTSKSFFIDSPSRYIRAAEAFLSRQRQ